MNGITGRFNSFFNHLSKVLKSDGEIVSRGEKFAESGMTGTFFPHLHYNNSFGRGNDVHYLDFYKPVFPLDPDHKGYWIAQDDWKNVSPSNNPNGANFWTRLNRPVFFQ